MTICWIQILKSSLSRPDFQMHCVSESFNFLCTKPIQDTVKSIFVRNYNVRQQNAENALEAHAASVWPYL